MAEYRGMEEYCAMNKLQKPILHNILNSETGLYPVLDRTAKRELLGILDNEKIDGVVCCGGNLCKVIEDVKSEYRRKGMDFPRTVVLNDGGGAMAAEEYIQIYKNLELCGFRAAEALYERFKNPGADIVRRLIPVSFCRSSPTKTFGK